MSISIYDISVPVFLNGLKVLSQILDKAEANAAERKIDPQVFVAARLAPDMHGLSKQIQIATDHAKGACARLTGQTPPRFEDTETTLGDLKQRLAKTADYIAGLPREAFDGGEGRTVELKIGQRELKFAALDYLVRFATPNFYFHMTTAYDILRHNGVPLGKRDFLGG